MLWTFSRSLILFSFALSFTMAGAQVSATNWSKISGPGNDAQCTGRCSTGMLIEAVECGGSSRGLMKIVHAQDMFCSGRAIDNRDVEVVNYNADLIAACLKAHPNKQEYNKFIHQMLCSWKLCQIDPPRNPREKVGSWREMTNQHVDINICKTRVAIDRCPDRMNITSMTINMGDTLDARNINLCDLRRTGDSVDSSQFVAPVASSAGGIAPAKIQNSQKASH